MELPTNWEPPNPPPKAELPNPRLGGALPRRGRPPRWLKEQTMQMGELARKKEEQAGPVADQAQVINEVMKKYPNLFKDNKQVRFSKLI